MRLETAVGPGRDTIKMLGGGYGEMSAKSGDQPYYRSFAYRSFAVGKLIVSVQRLRNIVAACDCPCQSTKDPTGNPLLCHL